MTDNWEVLIVLPYCYISIIKRQLFEFIIETYREIPLTFFPPSCNNEPKVSIKLESLYTVTALKFVGCYSSTSPNKRFGLKVKKVYSEEEVHVYNGVKPFDTLVFIYEIACLFYDHFD